MFQTCHSIYGGSVKITLTVSLNFRFWISFTWVWFTICISLLIRWRVIWTILQSPRYLLCSVEITLHCASADILELLRSLNTRIWSVYSNPAVNKSLSLKKTKCYFQIRFLREQNSTKLRECFIFYLFVSPVVLRKMDLDLEIRKFLIISQISTV